MKSIIVVATEEEEKIAKKRFKGHRIIKTGVGGINVVRTLKSIPKWHKITNFGYAGTSDIENLPIGTEVKVGYCSHYHITEYDEISYWKLGTIEDQIWCYTSDEFVENYDGETKGTIFDMELAYILALGFKKVESIKIISDYLSLNQYEENI